MDLDSSGFYQAHTYHLDVRFESAFTQMHILAEAIKNAIEKGKRVIVEHFDLIYPILDINAELLIGIGEEIIVTRPTIFGPEPQDIGRIVFTSIKYRRMAHTAEDLAERFLWEPFHDGYKHGDVRHGFLLEFDKKPDIDIIALENYVRSKIEQNLPVCYDDDQHIRIGEKLHHCTGPRMHVASTGEIRNFRMLHEIQYDPMSEKYLLVGLVGEESNHNMKDLNSILLG